MKKNTSVPQWEYCFFFFWGSFVFFCYTSFYEFFSLTNVCDDAVCYSTLCYKQWNKMHYGSEQSYKNTNLCIWFSMISFLHLRLMLEPTEVTRVSFALSCCVSEMNALIVLQASQETTQCMLCRIFFYNPLISLPFLFSSRMIHQFLIKSFGERNERC